MQRWNAEEMGQIEQFRFSEPANRVTAETMLEIHLFSGIPGVLVLLVTCGKEVFD